MSVSRAILPWAHRSGAYALPTSLLVRLKLGEVPAGIPAALDVRRKAALPADSTGHGALDRVVSSFGSHVQVSRLHAAARALRNVGARNMGYSEEEEVSGIARVLRFDVAEGTHVGSLAISLMQLDLVESAIPNYITTVGLDGPDMPRRPSGDDDGWDPRDLVNARRALAYEGGDASVIVGVVDSGLALEHPEFAGRLRHGYDTVQLGKGELAGGVALLGDNQGADTNPTDRYVGHGTGCAGIIGGCGSEMPPGLGGDCRMLPLRALGAARFPGRDAAVGVGALSDLDMALVMAAQLGAKVINCSFGTEDDALEPGAPKPHAEAVAFATARGCALVAASGNSGDDHIYWPAAFPDVIAVGSVALDRSVSSFSTHGKHVALCAPGERVRTASLDGYQSATGTSFAAPFVAGAAALLVARANTRAAALDPATIKSLLIDSAQPHRGDVGPGNGAGVLDAARALELLDQALDADETTELGGADDG
ncbi:S8 family serine peptidase [Sphingomonas sp. So64.6b]|uniref:S8 family peptidase n=1 Tax=Sphingomonas sp. So64.6b TaxID=2997354 RepID=UPI0016012862|nr:S8 family serine peptidase [Sphingomonas sp. So64.6b]QNA85376.1 S8 family serine peptidase [Sphingomonas sp. So64.6b]